MEPKKNAMILHSTVTKWSTLAMDAALGRSLAFDGLEIAGDKIANYLHAGYSPHELKTLLGGFDIPAVGFLRDIERRGAVQRDLMREAEELFLLARLAGARGVQVITGPINVQAVVDFKAGRESQLYSGLLGLPIDQQIDLTARNLAALADLAKPYGLVLYLEALAWTPLNTLANQLKIIRRANRDNLRIVIDYWHCYASGDTPETVAKLEKELIFGVHVCDSLQFDGGVPDEGILRNVSTGAGVLDLQAWTDAVKATGYDGWWSCELFCKRDQQGNSPEVAARLKRLMEQLVLSLA